MAHDAGLTKAAKDTVRVAPSAPDEACGAGVRIGDAAAQAGVSTRTLRYYEELGLLTPSGYTAGGERRYRDTDLLQLKRILELREVLGMNLEEIKGFLESERRLDEVRTAYRANENAGTKAARLRRKALLEEALVLNEALADQLNTKLARMDAFRTTLEKNAERCRALLHEFE